MKSSILPRPKTASSAGSSKSIGSPLYSTGSSGPRALGSRLKVTLIGARPMCRCLECSTISRNASMTPMWPISAMVSIHTLAVCPSGASSARHAVREERAPAVGEVLTESVDRGAAEEREGQDDQEDHEQDQPGAAGVRAVEPRRAAVLLGLGAQPDDREDDDAEQHGDSEEVLQEAQRIPAADQRNMEFRVEQNAIGLEVHRAEDEEAPHGEEMREAGDRPFQQLLLPEDFGELRFDPSGDVVLAAALVADRLTRPNQVGQELHAACGKHQHDGGGQQANHQPAPVESGHGLPPCRKLPNGNLVQVTDQ